jgi:hypothetical protein
MKLCLLSRLFDNRIIPFIYSIENRCRSSNYDLQNPQCPICQVALNGQDMIPHIQHELDTIERTRQQHKYSTRRSTAHLTNGNNKVSVIIICYQERN